MRFLITLSIFLTALISSAQVTDIRNYIFGHSLLVHVPQDTMYPGDEATVPHWVHSLAISDSKTYSVSGQYGFLPQHANLPPFAQWGFAEVPGAWESDTEPFSAADFTTVLLTAGNFVQDQPAHFPYYNEPVLSPLLATLDIVDWVTDQEEGIDVYIYENWPDMAGFIAGQGFPPSASEFSNYHDYTEGDFHDWWIAYQDSVQARRPMDAVKMIPVGPVIAKLLTETSLSAISPSALYEDNAPHGRPTIYFLAGLITYMAIYETPALANYNVPSGIDPLVAANYTSIVDIIWSYLQSFNYPDGASRVFTNDMTTTVADVQLVTDGIILAPNPTADMFTITGDVSDYNLAILDVNGQVHQTLSGSDRVEIDLSGLPAGIYFIRLQHQTNGSLHVELMLKQ